MRAYKVFNKNLKCIDFQYEIGETFEHDGPVVPCKSGFHCCKGLVDCFRYYAFDPKNRVCIVEASGKIIQHDDKIVCSKITIIRELKWSEVLDLVNTGNGNTGNSNTGDSNSGNNNTGIRNSGNWNSGSRNSGDGNTGDGNSGNNNTGIRNSGNWNSGSHNSGSSNTGYNNSGDSNSGSRNSGYSNTGDSNYGSSNTGYSNTGDSNTGHSNSGDGNTGYSNSGDSNSGDRNSGDSNTGSGNYGDGNTGHMNTGHRNTGDWNSGDWNSGCLNTKHGPFYIFDRISPIPRSKMRFPDFFYKTGVVSNLSYHESWAIAWENATSQEHLQALRLPNFCPEKFEQITGIKTHSLVAALKK